VILEHLSRYRRVDADVVSHSDRIVFGAKVDARDGPISYLEPTDVGFDLRDDQCVIVLGRKDEWTASDVAQLLRAKLGRAGNG
jgi:hypothetical protein